MKTQRDGSQVHRGRFCVLRYNHTANFDKCLEVEDTPRIRVTDEQAKRIIQKISNCQTSTEFHKLDPKLRDEYIAMFKQNGLSIRQISRLTGISKGLVEKYLKI